jgi:hypothetical protein
LRQALVQTKGETKMKIIIAVVVLATLGLLGFVTKSLIAILLGAVGVAVSFLIFCSGLFLSLLGKVIASIFSLLVLASAVLFVPAALILIIPGLYFAYQYISKRSRNVSGAVVI